MQHHDESQAVGCRHVPEKAAQCLDAASGGANSYDPQVVGQQALLAGAIKAAFWRWTATMQNIVARYCQVRAWVRPTGAAGIVAAAKGQLKANLAGLARREAGIQGNRPGD